MTEEELMELDRKLENKEISIVEYLSAVPAEYIPHKSELLNLVYLKIKNENAVLLNIIDAIRWFVRTIVHCRDCQYWASSLSEEDLAVARNTPTADCVCDLFDSDGFEPWDYCSHGKRRKNEEN